MTRLADFRRSMLGQGQYTAEHMDDYLESLLAHVCYVQEAGQRLGVDAARLLIHDQSKFSPR